MSYFRADTPSPIEDLLTKLDVAQAEDLSADQIDVQTPTLEQFLDEEDFLRECRSENSKLLDYLCKEQIICQLVDKAFNLPSLNLTQSNGQVQEQQMSTYGERDLNIKYAYVSCELLSSDNKRISEALVSNSQAMNKLFTVLDRIHPGTLNAVIALHFSKIIISLTKMQNSDVISLMHSNGSQFMTTVLNHIDSVPIAELIVRMLDSPELEDAYPAVTKKKPTTASLNLLSSTKVLGGLAESFVRACGAINIRQVNDQQTSSQNSAHDHQPQQQEPNENHQDPQFADVQEQVMDNLHYRNPRLREETMSNVIMTILGLTERILQLPELGESIPDGLNSFKSPEALCRLLDAGLYATCDSSIAKGHAQLSAMYTGSTEERIEAFMNGNSSPLIHTLGLAADLMTTEANIVRDDQEDVITSIESQSGRQIYGGGMSRHIYSGTGIAASIGVSTQQDPSGEDRSSNLKSDATTEYQKKKVGDKIVKTDRLESELSIRFPRLARMFGEKEVLDENGVRRPLGSLRLKLAEFFTACMKSTKDETVDQIINLGVPKKLLELFQVYQWSSMLHVVITKSIASALESHDKGRPARKAWFSAGLVIWLIDSWNNNTQAEEPDSSQSRAGYMGHLIRIGTALKGYIDEVQSGEYTNPNISDLPSEDELRRFNIFAEEVLAPAHHRELTPLCEEQLVGGHVDDDEVEDATDVLDIGIIGPESVTKENVNLKYTALRASDDLDDDEEIQPVEVDDLDHFGADEDPNIRHIVDHDIPPALREQMEKDEKESIEISASVVELAPSPISNHNDRIATSAISIEERRALPLQADDLRGIIDTVDSSSDDEGTYEEFVDDHNALQAANIGTTIGTLENDQGDPVTSSLDGVVTEIEEPDVDNGIHEITTQLDSSTVIDTGDSSDEEYEAWTDPVKVISPAPPVETTSSAPVAEERKDSSEGQSVA